MTDSERNPFDCKRCGACCVRQLVFLVHGDRVPLHLVDAGGIRLAHSNGRCAALVGRVGVDPRCSIYRDRPKMCRVFLPGSWACREIRADSGIFKPETEV